MASNKKSKKSKPVEQAAPETDKPRLAHDPQRARIVPRNRTLLAISIIAFSAWTLFLAWIAYRVNF